MKKLFIIFLIPLTTVLSCRQKNSELPSLLVMDVIGRVEVTLPSKDCKAALQGMAVPMGSRIAVFPRSKIRVGLNRYSIVSALENTVFSLDSIIGHGSRTLLTIHIDDGKLFCSISSRVRTSAFMVNTVEQNTCLSLRTDKEGRNAVIKAIGGPLLTIFPGNRSCAVPSCGKILVKEGQNDMEPLPLTTDDFKEIVSFAGKTIADSIIDNAFCPQTIQNEQNIPPQWEKSPKSKGEAAPGVTHVYKKVGVFTARVQVRSGDGKIADAQGKIIVHAKPIARISMSPLTVRANQECVFDAGRSSVSDSSAAFEVRWDLDNNGTWDYPDNGGYTSIKTIKKTWNKAGRYTVVLEIRDQFGSLAWASADVNVLAPRTPAKAVDSVAPLNRSVSVNAGGKYRTHVNSPVIFKTEAKDPAGAIKSFWWDFQGKGIYDTSLTTAANVRHVYSKPGTYRAVVKAMTGDSKEWFDTATVEVVNSPPVAHAGRDLLSEKGKKIALHGTGEDSDGRVALYEWDFNGDGSYEWSSPKNGEVKHVFNDYSIAVLRVTDDNGAAGLDTVRVVICPEGMTGVESGPLCIDEYEWPNIRGKEPLRDISFFEARDKCISVGKRLCASKEWEAACAGKRGPRYPKSRSPDEQNCNVAGNRFFANRIAPSGSFPDCKSPAGAYDMNGNVDEWTESGDGDSAMVYGGSWHHNLADAQCSSRFPLLKNKGFFYVGFRCCK